MAIFANKSGGFYLTALAAILTLVSLIVYNSVMYTYTLIYVLLVAALVLEVLPLFLNIPFLTGVAPVANAVLNGAAGMGSAVVMVNQIAYVVTGLDQMSTITSYIVFASVAIVAMLVNIVAAFLKWEK
ncbi:MAG: hypothetical protein LUF84_05290 [Clostridiales bacterium]|nr:hypothetical protein [Clostridiales bacterium]MCD7917853.1 hypothetical protein [Clostridiales bacterium]